MAGLVLLSRVTITPGTGTFTVTADLKQTVK